jgi:osmotically inducible lipoprotein OsmB
MRLPMQRNLARGALALALILPLAACEGLNRQQQRALSGGAIGAAGGAAIGAITGGSAVTGALIGGAAGAATGALTSGR